MWKNLKTTQFFDMLSISQQFDFPFITMLLLHDFLQIQLNLLTALVAIEAPHVLDQWVLEEVNSLAAAVLEIDREIVCPQRCKIRTKNRYHARSQLPVLRDLRRANRHV